MVSYSHTFVFTTLCCYSSSHTIARCKRTRLVDFEVYNARLTSVLTLGLASDITKRAFGLKKARSRLVANISWG